jgi:sulfate transport system permease protein
VLPRLLKIFRHLENQRLEPVARRLFILADGIDHLRRATDVADPDVAPFGVTPKLWQRTCELAEDIVDALVDLPFALPTAVAGIALTAIYAENGLIGQFLPFKVSFTPLGVFVALVFIGLPFVVRTVQPVLEDLNRALEEAAATLGAHRWQTFRHVIFPTVMPALLTGFALAFARALGEYGSVIFIAGNLPFVSEITPLLIITKLEQYDYAGATAIAVVMLVVSFVLLLVINALQAWARKRQGGI